MGSGYDEMRRIRNEVTCLGQDVATFIASSSQTGGDEVLVVQTFTETTYPTVANAFYACHPCRISGAEAEGVAATVTPSTRKLYVYNVGTSIPPAGTNRVATLCGGRWTMNYSC